MLKYNIVEYSIELVYYYPLVHAKFEYFIEIDYGIHGDFFELR